MPQSAKTAVIHRMVMPSHTCPYGLKSRHLLTSRGYEVEDHHLTTREETDAFKAEHGVTTTPQKKNSDNAKLPVAVLCIR